MYHVRVVWLGHPQQDVLLLLTAPVRSTDFPTEVLYCESVGALSSSSSFALNVTVLASISGEYG